MSDVVPDALSRRLVAMILTEQKSLIEEMRRLNLEVIIPGECLIVWHCNSSLY